ncbi:MAG: hypothetical protein DRJ52_04480 [Thermoprotei archaeon]|nr:MAG: hypothetical protein DRJ52_04480 [Thermoprotei archaeon]RLF00943.1 MAG: hypothetical protein DRJ63_00860 [Thermoprotei archaeon]
MDLSAAVKALSIIKLLKDSIHVKSIDVCYFLLKSSFSHAQRRDSLAAYVYLRACLEHILELYYIYSRYSQISSEGLKELLKLKRKGRAFTLKIINQVKGIPGPFKKKIAKTYISIATQLHPPFELKCFDTAEYCEDFKRVVDITAFLILKIFREKIPAKTIEAITERGKGLGLYFICSKSVAK